MLARLTRTAALGMALLSAPLFAATTTGDVEIYVGGSSGTAGVLPNVLFIVDTSGSMGDPVPYSLDYDPKEIYPWAGYDTDKVYVAGANHNKGYPEADDWFHASVNYCDAAVKAINEFGYYASDTLAMYPLSTELSKRKWIAPKVLDSTTRSYPLECAADYGKHGTNASDPYPTNYTIGGFTSSEEKPASQNFKDWGTGARSIFSGNYLNFLKSIGSDHTALTRMEVVKNTLKAIFGSVSGINAAIMRFDNATSDTYTDGEPARGGYLVTPMLPLDSSRADYETNKTTLIRAVTALSTPSYTPTAETLYEAGLFFQGLAPKFGANVPDRNVVPSGVIKDGKYVSPMEYQCQNNFIVFLSDGDPTADDEADDDINAQPDFMKITESDTKCAYTTHWGDITGDCAEEQAKYLHNRDLSKALPDTQTVTIYTIGFAAGMSEFGTELMNSVATNGGGFYRPSTTMADIIAAFNDIMTNIQSVNTSFTAPAVSVNAFNRLTYLDEIYFAVFRPSSNPKWDGNVKRYRLAKPEGESSLALLDANDAKAIDPATGFFKETSTSYWSDEVDGPDVTLGGAAGEMSLPRNVYTCCFAGKADFTDPANLLSEDETQKTYLTETLLGADDEDERVAIIKWARGVDVEDSDEDKDKTDPRPQMGDPLHTEPVLVTYGKLASGAPDMTLYTATNEGFLHAINTTNGTDVFSWIPTDLLGNLKPMKDRDATKSHPFGLDGPLTAWIYDEDHDNTIDPATDHVYLYVTQRRGGNHIYAIDVTNRSAPTMKWTITGGTTGVTGDFTELGETWSKLNLARVKIGDVAKTVLIFGGGYDEGQTGASVATDDDIGRAIYMVDAASGKLLWSAGPGSWANLKLTDMTNSIPSEVRVLDIDGDGFTDRLYVGDMGGRIWRIDINNDNATGEPLATGGVLAKFSDDSKEGNRRFYYPPAVSMSSRGEYLDIAIGSGFREHPLDRTIQDRFYVLHDRNVDKPESKAGVPVYTPLTNLVDATDWLTSGAVDQSALSASDGFYILLKTDGKWQGEKVLAQAVTMNGYVIFTTYTPVMEAHEDSCAPTEGMARAYVMSIHDGTTMPGATGRYQTLPHGGIPPRPVIITVPDGSAVMIGTNLIDATMFRNQLTKTNWRRN